MTPSMSASDTSRGGAFVGVSPLRNRLVFKAPLKPRFRKRGKSGHDVSDQPRDEHGRFGEGGGEETPAVEQYRRELAAYQGRQERRERQRESLAAADDTSNHVGYSAVDEKLVDANRQLLDATTADKLADPEARTAFADTTAAYGERSVAALGELSDGLAASLEKGGADAGKVRTIAEKGKVAVGKAGEKLKTAAAKHIDAVEKAGAARKAADESQAALDAHEAAEPPETPDESDYPEAPDEPDADPDSPEYAHFEKEQEKWEAARDKVDAKFEAAHEKWSGQRDRLEGQRDRADEKADAADEKASDTDTAFGEALDHVNETYTTWGDKVNDAVIDASADREQELDAEELKDDEPEEPEEEDEEEDEEDESDDEPDDEPGKRWHAPTPPVFRGKACLDGMCCDGGDCDDDQDDGDAEVLSLAADVLLALFGERAVDVYTPLGGHRAGKTFDPDQPRDEHGRFGEGGGERPEPAGDLYLPPRHPPMPPTPERQSRIAAERSRMQREVTRSTPVTFEQAEEELTPPAADVLSMAYTVAAMHGGDGSEVTLARSARDSDPDAVEVWHNAEPVLTLRLLRDGRLQMDSGGSDVKTLRPDSGGKYDMEQASYVVHRLLGRRTAGPYAGLRAPKEIRARFDRQGNRVAGKRWHAAGKSYEPCRDDRGRFAECGAGGYTREERAARSRERSNRADALTQDALKGTLDAKGMGELGDHLLTMTKDELKGVIDRNGLEVTPGKFVEAKAELVSRMGQRLNAVRAEETARLREEFTRVRGARPPNTMSDAVLRKQIAQAQGTARPAPVEREKPKAKAAPTSTPQPAPEPKHVADAVNLGDPQTLAHAVHAAAASLPDAIGGHTNGPDLPGWQSHKPLIADVYDAMKPQLGGASLEDFKAALVRANQAGTLALYRNDLPQAVKDLQTGQTLTPSVQDRIGRSMTPHMYTSFDVVDTNSPAAQRARQEGVATKSATKASDKPGFTGTDAPTPEKSLVQQYEEWDTGAETRRQKQEQDDAARVKHEKDRERKRRSEVRRLVNVGLGGGVVSRFELRQLIEAGVGLDKIRKYMSLQAATHGKS